MDENRFNQQYQQFQQNNRSENRMSDRDSRIARLFSDDFQAVSQQPQPQQQTASQVPTYTNPAIVIKNPKSYEDVRILIDHLKKREQVIINFSDVNQNTVCRILDFMSGAVYALNGSIQEISKNVFIFAPEGVTISVPPTLM